MRIRAGHTLSIRIVIRQLKFRHSSIVTPPKFQLSTYTGLIRHNRRNLTTSNRSQINQVVIMFNNTHNLQDFNHRFTELRVRPSFINTYKQRQPKINSVPKVTTSLMMLSLPRKNLLPLRNRIRPFRHNQRFNNIRVLQFRSFRQVRRMIIPTTSTRPKIFLSLLIRHNMPN